MSEALPSDHRLSSSTLLVALLLLLGALISLFRIPPVLHEAIDFHRAERWSRGERADQAAFVLTVLHRAHPDSARIAIALAHAQQRAGDHAAMEKTIDELRATDPVAAGRAGSELNVAPPQGEAGQGSGT